MNDGDFFLTVKIKVKVTGARNLPNIFLRQIDRLRQGQRKGMEFPHYEPLRLSWIKLATMAMIEDLAILVIVDFATLVILWGIWQPWYCEKIIRQHWHCWTVCRNTGNARVAIFFLEACRVSHALRKIW